MPTLLKMFYLFNELNIGESSKQLLDSVVGDGVRPPPVGKRFVFDCHQQVPEVILKEKQG